MVRATNFWLLSDGRGYMWRLACEDFSVTQIMEFHSGKITDMAVSDAYNLALTCAEDG